MKYLTADEITVINHVVAEESGGSIGIREAGLLKSIATKPRTNIYGEDAYPDIFLKAAVLYEALVNYHVFIDGNKRTGFAALARFMHINKYTLNVTDMEIENYTVFVATSNPDLAEIATWIKQHAEKEKK